MKRIYIYLTAALLLAAGVSVFAGGDREFSEMENRQLTVISDVTEADILSGDFQEALTDYVSDQIPGRDEMMKISSDIWRLTGRKDISGVYISGGTYFQKILDKDINYERYENNLKKIEDIACKFPDKNVTVMLVPDSGNVLKDELPRGAAMYDYNEMIKTAERLLPHCNVVHAEKQLKKYKGRYIYYRTDHHWTLEGAFAGYEALTGRECDFEKRKVCDDFLGTLYSKAPVKGAEADTIEIPVLKSDVKVTADGKEIPLFDREALKEKDKYKVYFGGNYGLTEVESGVNDRKICVIKDSFANCFVPLLTEDYGHIVMADMRYTSCSIDMIAGDADEILILYQMSNFAGDTGISKLMF